VVLSRRWELAWLTIVGWQTAPDGCPASGCLGSWRSQRRCSLPTALCGSLPSCGVSRVVA